MTEFPDWFSAYAKPNFEKFLLPLAGKRDLRFLQLGAYTGDATRWLDFNVLTNPDGLLIDIDTWEGSDEDAHEALDFNEVYLVYQQKIAKCESVCHYRITTDDFFIKQRHRIEGPFDFTYIDADHTTVGVLLDAEHAWPHVKSGGLLAFDDYKWGAHLPPSKSPKLGIDLFLERHQGEFITLEVGLQYWIQKL